MGRDADAAENRWLREAMENAVPFIYFLGIAPGVYRALIPSFVIGWEPGSLKARIAFRAEEEADSSSKQGRRKNSGSEPKTSSRLRLIRFGALTPPAPPPRPIYRRRSGMAAHRRSRISIA